ncbi:uncharacterized protein G2W53_043794 [Senna tora]|uniref:Uncharacterized protein n=1 Tax=Senna tora TaxID=362788 RepID=A0A834SIB6_9FABA|nr:uncharacterized protein G2W53_043794 [Senna tora]
MSVATEERRMHGEVGLDDGDGIK